MSASIRFLGVAVLAWAGVRAASLGLVPGMDGLAPAAEAATAPAASGMAQPAYSPPPWPMAAPSQSAGGYYAPYGPYPLPASAYPGYPAYPQAMPVPYYIPVPAAYPRPARYAARPSAWDEVMPTPSPQYGGWEVVASTGETRLAAGGIESGSKPHPSAPATTSPGASPAKGIDRLQLSSWALLRGSWGPGNLATGGSLGGSQVGARLTYNFTPSLAATLRSSSSVGGVRYAEVAAGVKWKPFASWPVALTLERRQALNRWGGRSAFALFAEGGLYQKPVFGLANLDLYAQGGIVGFNSRDLFFDGGATFTRPLWKKFSGGLGVWGGVQPGLYRFDAGPRLSYEVGRGIRLHADYRQRLAGEAMPASGPALTIAGDF